MNKISYHAPGHADSHLITLIRQFHQVASNTPIRNTTGPNITLRPFCIETDMSFIHSWINKKYKSRYWNMNGLRQESLEKYYHILHLNNEKLLIAFADQKAVCILEVYQAIKEEVSLHYRANQEDYGIRVLMNPSKKVIAEVYTSILQACVRQLFSFSYVKKIILEVDDENELENQLTPRAGFTLQQKIAQRHDAITNLYCCTRESKNGD